MSLALALAQARFTALTNAQVFTAGWNSGPSTHVATER